MLGDSAQLYEIGYHLVPTLAEDKVGAEIARLRQAVESRSGVVSAEEWPKHMELAYTIARREGSKRVRYDTSYFGWIRFTMDQTQVPDLQEALSEVDTVLRCIIVAIPDETKRPPKKHRQILKRESAEEAQTVEEKPEVATEEIDKEIEKLIAE